jgi:peptide/nickel transport system permease protein
MGPFRPANEMRCPTGEDVPVGASLPKCSESGVPILDIAGPAGVLVVIAFACFLLPLVYAMPSPVGGSVADANIPVFSHRHVLGTDMNGNDNLSRLLHGGRTSLEIAFFVNLIGITVGGILGMVSGYIGGVLDAFIMRVLDVLIAFPSLVLVLAVAQVLGPGYANTIMALAFVSVPAFARVARSATLRLRSQAFLTSAALCGTRTGGILICHVVPNIYLQLVSFSLLGMGIVITIEGGLSYLGLGVQPPQPSWGSMIFQAQQVMTTSPTLLVLPCAFLFFSVLAFNLLGEAIRKRSSTR